MLVLLETPLGFGVFKASKKLKKISNLQKEYLTPQNISNLISLEKFVRFTDAKDALDSTAGLVEGKLGKKLKKLLKKLYVTEHCEEALSVSDKKLATAINAKFNVSVINDASSTLIRKCIMENLDQLLPDVQDGEITRMRLGLSHSLNRYKLKCSPDKIDTMIVQAVSMLDDLDKELNNYVMRCKEMYGWHFPELVRIVEDHSAYVRLVRLIGQRENALSMSDASLAEALSGGDATASSASCESLISSVREAARISCGSDLMPEDFEMIRVLCDQVVEIGGARAELYEYLKRRMLVVAPNLTAIVGELLGARLIAHAGTLVSLAKNASSTTQILGAEKALFRALKQNCATPKYGLLYHASLVSSTCAEHRGKMSRLVANKAALAARTDAFADDDATQRDEEDRDGEEEGDDQDNEGEDEQGGIEKKSKKKKKSKAAPLVADASLGMKWRADLERMQKYFESGQYKNFSSGSAAKRGAASQGGSGGGFGGGMGGRGRGGGRPQSFGGGERGAKRPRFSQ